MSYYGSNGRYANPGYSPYPGQMAQPYGGYQASYPAASQASSDINVLVNTTAELRGSQYEVKQMNYQGRIQQWHTYTFSHPRLMNAMFELDLPQSFPREQPWLYIRPQEGYRVVHTLNYANADGLVTFPHLMEKSTNFRLSEYFNDFFNGLGNYPLVVANLKPQYAQQLKDQLRKDFSTRYANSLSQLHELEKVEQEMKEQAEIIKTLQDDMTKISDENSKKFRKYMDEKTNLQKQKEFINKNGNQLAQDYRKAFTFPSENRRLYVELECCEKAAKDVHNIYHIALAGPQGKQNPKETLDAIRKNGKVMFEARFLKDVVKARMGDNAYGANRGASGANILQQVGPSMFL